jgi:hypothetical protein
MILLVLLLGYLMMTVGLVWLFGPWALVACGIVLVALTIFMDLEVFSNE